MRRHIKHRSDLETFVGISLALVILVTLLATAAK